MITFDPINKIIQLDRLNVSEREIWTAYVDWAVLSDNLKYGVGLTQLGGNAPVALYVYLDLGWKIRPIEADGVTNITGNLLTEDGSSPVTATIGNFNILVNLVTPVQASAIEVGGGTQLSQVLAAINALNNFNPVTDVVSKVSLVDVTTDLTNGSSGGSNGATAAEIVAAMQDVADDFKADVSNLSVDLTPVQNVVNAILQDTDELQSNQGDWVTGQGTNDAVTSLEIANLRIELLGEHNATQQVLSNYAIDLAPIQTTVDAILVDTNELQQNQGNWITATGFLTNSLMTNLYNNLVNKHNQTQLMIDNINIPASFTIVELHDGLNSYTNKNAYKADVSTLSNNVNVVRVNGVTVTDINDFKADVSSLPINLTPVLDAITALNNFDPANDTVARVTLVDTTTVNTDMRGTDNANTVEPDNVSIASILEDTSELQLNQDNWLTATGFSTHNEDDVVTSMQIVADDFKANVNNITIDTSSIVNQLNGQILDSIKGLGIQAPPPAYTQNFAVTADGSVILEAPNPESVSTDTENEMKNYTYRDVAGLHWPDASAGEDTYYAIDLTGIGLDEGDTVTSVDWVLPNTITSSDSYLNSDASEAHVKLATPTSGTYRIWGEINSTDLSKTSKNRVRIILKVV